MCNVLFLTLLSLVTPPLMSFSYSMFLQNLFYNTHLHQSSPVWKLIRTFHCLKILKNYLIYIQHFFPLNSSYFRVQKSDSLAGLCKRKWFYSSVVLLVCIKSRFSSQTYTRTYRTERTSVGSFSLRFICQPLYLDFNSSNIYIVSFYIWHIHFMI